MMRSRRRDSLRRWGRRAAKSLAGDLDFGFAGMRSFHTSSSWRVLSLCGGWKKEERNRPGVFGRTFLLFSVPRRRPGRRPLQKRRAKNKKGRASPAPTSLVIQFWLVDGAG